MFEKRITFLLVAVSVALAAGSPIGSPRRPSDELPQLSDTLAVAKSPFEPITLAQVVDANARNESPATASMAPIEAEQSVKTTRSTQSLIEQEKDTTPVRVSLDEQASEESSPATVSTEVGTTQTSADGAETITVADTEAASTGTKQEDRQAEIASTPPTSAPATDITLGTIITTTAAPVSTNSDQAETTTTTEAPSSPAEEPTRPVIIEPVVSTEAPSTGSSETQAPAVEAAPATTGELAATTTAAPEPVDEVKRVEEQVKPVEEQAKPVEEQARPVDKEGAAPVVSVGIELTTSSPAIAEVATTTTTTTITTAAPVVETTTTELPATSASATTTTAPETTEPSSTTTTTTTTTSTTTAKPTTEPEDKKDEKQQAGCNHLPTYDAEEVQKVFREETTFRNGTIKGKFTYINFDQRYRLVHYTRLPYGPVKIDLVEELGRPEPSNSTRSPAVVAPNPNEIPNAVLQLRNILPNSLFGFPFVAPNSAANKPLDPRDGAPSPGSSFYSTESLSTPNLLSSNVPVSVLSGRRESDSASPSSQQDTLSQNLNDNIALSAPSAQPAPANIHTPKLGLQPSWDNLPPVGVSPINNLQFQYALAAQANHLEHTKQQQNSGPAYTYMNQQSAQYQYSPLPLYTFQQPSYFTAHHHSLPGQPATVAVATSPIAKSTPLLSHQPHDHEHYIAPFMLSQTPGSEQPSEPQPARLKLRVKTAKSLNHNSGGLKSAQLRAQDEFSGQQYYQHHSSPVQAYRQSSNSHGRHRSGKQNQELRPTINSAPVVYHVLRSPVGRMYSLPQYRNVHAVAYDLDE